MRFLLDTNILIPLEDSMIVLQPSLTNFSRLANQHGHPLLFHPASKMDIARDKNLERQQQTLKRIERYQELDNPPECPWNTERTNENDRVDNEILYALERNCSAALVTEDVGIHKKALTRGLSDRVYFIQTANDLLERLHSEQAVQLPNIQDLNLYQIKVEIPFFDSLRNGYDSFNKWYTSKAQNGTKAWVYGEHLDDPQAMCIYDVQTNERITDAGLVLGGDALKLCTFKVGESVRGKKIGELFLKAAFRYATDNQIENIFITAKSQEQDQLVSLLTDFGFEDVGSYGEDSVFLKKHPVAPPKTDGLESFEYMRQYFPHYMSGDNVGKFIIPIQPQYHEILFPDYVGIQGDLFSGALSTTGNAIKLAYLSHAQLNQISEGDIVLFYRSDDLKAVTSVGVVEKFSVSSDADEIAQLVSRRTVYNMEEIRRMAGKKTKVILFRLISHFPEPVTYNWMKKNEVVNGYIQSIRGIGNDQFRRFITHAESRDIAID